MVRQIAQQTMPAILPRQGEHLAWSVVSTIKVIQFQQLQAQLYFRGPVECTHPNHKRYGKLCWMGWYYLELNWIAWFRIGWKIINSYRIRVDGMKGSGVARPIFWQRNQSSVTTYTVTSTVDSISGRFWLYVTLYSNFDSEKKEAVKMIPWVFLLQCSQFETSKLLFHNNQHIVYLWFMFVR